MVIPDPYQRDVDVLVEKGFEKKRKVYCSECKFFKEGKESINKNNDCS